MINLYKSTETAKLIERIGGELFERQRSSRHACVPIGKSGYFMAFYWCDIKNARHHEERVCMYCDASELMLVGDCARCAEILRSLPEDMLPFRALAEFLMALTVDDMDTLERFETDINELEDSLITSKKPIAGASKRIITLRHALLTMKRYYDQLGLLVDRLLENEKGAVPDDACRLLAAFDRRNDRLTESVLHLREYVTQVREAYQAQIDIEQNQIMKLFTVLTAIFLPLTLIVGWYGMNFSIPEYNWPLGYLYVTALSVLVCALSFAIFKRKKWF